MLDREDEYEKMFNVEQRHWWYKCLHSRVVCSIESVFECNREISILDLGCGTGGLLHYLSRLGYRNIHGLDKSEFGVNYCQSRGLDVDLGAIEEAYDLFGPACCDVVILNDVLYFVDQSAWKALLSNLSLLLRRGGLMIINLPAHPAFTGIHDVAVGITDRLSVADIDEVYDADILKLIKTTHWPTMLAPLIYIIRRLQAFRMSMRDDIEIKSDVSMPPSKWLNHVLFKLACMDFVFMNKIGFSSSIYLQFEKIERT